MNRATPRTSYQFRQFGKCLGIDKNTISEMVKKVKPLDVVVYKSHVMIVDENKNILEARADKQNEYGTGGLFETSFKERFEELFSLKKAPVSHPRLEANGPNDWFSIHRPDFADMELSQQAKNKQINNIALQKKTILQFEKI